MVLLMAKKKKFGFDFCVYSIYEYLLLFFFAFGFCVYWCFQSTKYPFFFFFFFSNITIVVNLYGTTHGKKIIIKKINLLLVFMFTAYTGIFYFFGFWLLAFGFCV
jgi:hypothetical protein